MEATENREIRYSGQTCCRVGEVEFNLKLSKLHFDVEEDDSFPLNFPRFLAQFCYDGSTSISIHRSSL
jgi:hypothetical protein